MTKNDFVAVDFYVTEKGSLNDAFQLMKYFQKQWLATFDSQIIYKDVAIPAGYCNSLSMVKSIYQAIIDCATDEEIENMILEHRRTNRIKDFQFDPSFSPRSVDSSRVNLNFRGLRENGDSLFNCYRTMRKYQMLGFADQTANIEFNRVIIPAGYFRKVDDVFDYYYFASFPNQDLEQNKSKVYKK